MAEQEPKNQNDFMIEKIKERPLSKKKLLKRTMVTAAMAVIFGLIACFTFLVLEPVLNNLLHPKDDPAIVVFPEDEEEVSPEDMLSTSMLKEGLMESYEWTSGSSEVHLDNNQIKALLSKLELDKNHVAQQYKSMSQYVDELMTSMVTITGTSSRTDWLSSATTSEEHTYGVIIEAIDQQLFVLVDFSTLKKAKDYKAKFWNGTKANAEKKSYDPVTGLAVLSVDISNIREQDRSKTFSIAKFGVTSDSMDGIPVVALGDPMGSGSSRDYGMITTSSAYYQATDANFRLIQTDMIGSRKGAGILFNLNGEVVGMITSNGTTGNDGMSYMMKAYAITDLKTRIQKMCKGEKFAYFGLIGTSVPEDEHSERGIPLGAYITDKKMASKIQQGDIITAINDHQISSYEEYTDALLKIKPGETVHFTVRWQLMNEYTEREESVVAEELKEK